MNDNFYNDETLRKFLLGDVPDDLRVTIEDHFLSDDDSAGQLLVVEDELIEDYLSQKLSSLEKDLFEKVFLTNPIRRERVVAMKGVIAAANAEAALIAPQRAKDSFSFPASVSSFLRFENPLLRYAFAAIALLILLGGTWFLVKRLNQNKDERIAINKTPEKIAASPTPLISFSPTPKTEPTPTPSPTPKIETQSSEPTFATVILRPTLLRDPKNATKFVLAPSIKQARIQLNLERDDYKSYVVRITTVEGNPIWQGGPLSARITKSGRAIVINLPTKLLPENDYIIELSGVSEAGPIESFADYFFSVTHK